MEVQEQETGILSDEDFLLVEHLTGELISRALDLCDEKVNSFDEIIESGSYLPPWVDRNVEDVVNKITASSKNKKPKFSSSENLMVRSNSVDVSLTCLQTSNPGEDCVTPSWRRSLRRTMSEAALSLVDEGVEVEYLEHFDPFKGNFDVVSQVGEVLATSANKHPAEQTSFLQALQEMSLGSCYETPNSVGLNCADSDEVDDTDDVDGGFACKTQAMAEGEDGLTECMTPQNPLVLTSEISGIHNSNMPYSFSVGLSNSSESCSVDTDVENHGSLPVDLGNSMKRTNHTSEDDKKFCVQDFNEDRILNSASLKTADFDCRSNIVITKSEIDEYAPHNHTDDRVTDDTSDRVTDDSSDRVTDDSNDRVTDDTNDRGTDDTTSDRMTDDSNDRVTVDTNNRVTDDVNDRVTDDTSNRVTDDTNDRVTDDSNDRMTDDANDRVTDDTNDRVTDDSNDRVTDDSNDRVTDDTNDRVTDDTTDRVIDDIVESSSPSCLLNVHAEKDTSTCNCISSTTLQSDQDTFCKPALSHITPNSVISDTADVSIADRSPDLRVADTNQVQPLDLNETVSDGDEVGNLSFLSTDTEGDFSSFSAAEKFVREVLSRSRSSSSTSSPRKSSSGAAINADSRMYNTLTFLDNDDSDDGDGETGKNKSTTEAANGSEKLDNHKHPASDVNDNPPEADEENGSVVHPADSDPTAAKKKIVPNLELLTCDDLDLNFSPRGDSVPDLHLGDYYNDHTPDDLVSPDDLANPVFDSIDDWADDPDEPPVEPIPEYTAREEYEDVRNWRPVQIAGISYRIDMRAIEPYKKVLSHGGYYGNGLNAIVVFAACYLPDRSRLDYRYIMDNLFLYVVSVLELLVVEDYMIIYFHAASSRSKVPALRWLKRCYDMIDHRLRKNLQRLLVVHPTFFLRTVVLMTKPFISSKFSSKLHYVRSLSELTRLVPTEYIHLPDEVKETDRSLNPNTPTPQKKFVNL